jgi:hypothetical protein
MQLTKSGKAARVAQLEASRYASNRITALPIMERARDMLRSAFCKAYEYGGRNYNLSEESLRGRMNNKPLDASDWTRTI